MLKETPSPVCHLKTRALIAAESEIADILGRLGNFSGVTQDLVNTIMNKAVTTARLAGARW